MRHLLAAIDTVRQPAESIIASPKAVLYLLLGVKGLDNKESA